MNNYPPVLENNDFKRYETSKGFLWQDPKVGIAFDENRQVERVYISSYWRAAWLDELENLNKQLEEMCQRNINLLTINIKVVNKCESTKELRQKIEEAENNEKLWKLWKDQK